jgi:Co/Zn/Cd efflux system component
MRADPVLVEAVRQRIETNDDRIADLHLWRIGPGHLAAAISVVSDHPASPHAYKARLCDLPGLSHLTVEVGLCPEHTLREAA